MDTTIVNRIKYDPTINLGHLLTILTLVGIGVAGWYNLESRVGKLEDARGMQKEIYATRIKVVDKRLDDHDRRFDDQAAEMRAFRDKIDNVKDLIKK